MSTPPRSAVPCAFGLLASLERLVPHSRLRLRSLQWHLQMHWFPESDPPRYRCHCPERCGWISLRGWCGTVFSRGFFNSSHRLRLCTCIRMRLGREGAHTSSIVSCPGCDRSRGSCSKSIFSQWRWCFGIALILGAGHSFLCGRNVRRRNGCVLRQPVGRASVPLPLLVGQSPSEVVRVSRPPPR